MSNRPEKVSEPRRGAGTVLLVDDEDIVRLTTADMLLELGYEVVEANSADAALDLVREGLEPDLLVSDHLMPGLSGADLARQLRETYPGLTVLVVSGYAQDDGLSPDLPRLTKPFRSDDLAAGLNALKS
jgi:CheY-like chemotaxis protein